VRSGMLDLIVVGYLQLMGAEHLTGNRATACRLSRAGSRSSRESSIWIVIAVGELDGGIEQRPGGSDRLDGQPPPTDRGDRLGRRASVEWALTDVVA